MGKTNKSKAGASQTAITKQNGIPRTRGLAGKGISTEAAVDAALNAIFDDLADDRADFEKTRYMLSAIGKKMNMENMKIRAGLYKGDHTGKQTGAKFFLNA